MCTDGCPAPDQALNAIVAAGARSAVRAAGPFVTTACCIILSDNKIRNLPSTIDEPVIWKFTIAGMPILTYAAIAPGKLPSSSRGLWRTSSFASSRASGGLGVDRIGSVEREIRVDLNPIVLQAIGMTAIDVSRQLRASNVDLAGGRSEIGDRIQTIRTLPGAERIADLAATRIALPGGGDVRLDNLGLITDTIAEPRTFARFHGTPVVGFNVLRPLSLKLRISSGISERESRLTRRRSKQRTSGLRLLLSASLSSPCLCPRAL